MFISDGNVALPSNCPHFHRDRSCGHADSQSLGTEVAITRDRSCRQQITNHQQSKFKRDRKCSTADSRQQIAITRGTEVFNSQSLGTEVADSNNKRDISYIHADNQSPTEQINRNRKCFITNLADSI